MTKPDQSLIDWAQYLAKGIVTDAARDNFTNGTFVIARMMMQAGDIVPNEITPERPDEIYEATAQCKARIMSTLFGPLLDHLCEIKRDVACLDIAGQPQHKAIQKLDMLIQLLIDMTGTRPSLGT